MPVARRGGSHPEATQTRRSGTRTRREPKEQHSHEDGRRAFNHSWQRFEILPHGDDLRVLGGGIGEQACLTASGATELGNVTNVPTMKAKPPPTRACGIRWVRANVRVHARAQPGASWLPGAERSRQGPSRTAIRLTPRGGKVLSAARTIVIQLEERRLEALGGPESDRSVALKESLLALLRDADTTATPRRSRKAKKRRTAARRSSTRRAVWSQL
jgi:hypothetical protein